MIKANELIQKYGFRKAFEVALQNNLLDVAKEIGAIEKRMFGTYRNAISSTTQFPVCPNPLRIDTYNTCPFACSYCFAGNTGKEITVAASVPRIRRVLDKVFNNGKLSGKELSFATMVKNGWPIHVGGMNDIMPPVEKHKKVFYNTLKKISEYEHPTIVSTKSHLPLHDDSYVDLFVDMRDNLVFQMSLITMDNWQYLEKHVTRPHLRIKTLEKLCNAGINCVVRAQPFMPQLVDEQIKLFKLYSEIGVKAVIVEGLKLKKASPIKKTKYAIMRTFGIEIDKELTVKRYSKSIYPIETKVKYHRILREVAHQNNLVYLVADNNLRFMGDSPNCCGTDLINAKTNEYNITHLSYTNPDDFGFHNIRNIENDYFNLQIDYADFKPKKRNIRETLQHLYNDDEWIFKTYEHTYTDSNNDKHYRIKSQYRL